MPTKHLPSNPSLEHLKYQAKDLLKAHQSQNSEASQRIREFHPRFSKSTDAFISETKFTLSDAQLTIAREYGFPNWARLRAHVEKMDRADSKLPHHERIEDAVFRRAVDLLDAGDADGLRTHLNSHPRLVHQRANLKAAITSATLRCWNSPRKTQSAAAACHRTLFRSQRLFSTRAGRQIQPAWNQR